MKKFVISISCMIGFGGAMAFASIPFDSVAQVIVYEHDTTFDLYRPVSAGSAVIIGNKVITNAHVVIDRQSNPHANIELCITVNTRERPACGFFPKLEMVDVDNDLAILSLDNKLDVSGVALMDENLEIGEAVSLVGYPSNGGATITLTQGKISGFDSGLYKIDASIDGGNSGGGAFDDEGRLIGIPSFAIDGLTALGYIIPVVTIKKFIAGETTHDIVTTPVNDDFVEYRRGFLKILTDGVIDDGVIKTDPIGSYGFDFIGGLTSGRLGTSQYQFVNRKQDTLIQLRKYAQSNSQYRSTTTLDLITKSLKEVFDTVYTKEMSLQGNRRRVYYVQGSDSNPHLKELFFVQLGKEHGGITFSITGDSQDTKGFVQGIKYFLGGISLPDSYEEVDMFNIGQISLPNIEGVTYLHANKPSASSIIEIIFNSDVNYTNSIAINDLGEKLSYNDDEWQEEIDGLIEVFSDHTATVVNNVKYDSIILKLVSDEDQGYHLSLFDHEGDNTILYSMYLLSDKQEDNIAKTEEFMKNLAFDGDALDFKGFEIH